MFVLHRSSTAWYTKGHRCSASTNFCAIAYQESPLQEDMAVTLQYVVYCEHYVTVFL